MFKTLKNFCLIGLAGLLSSVAIPAQAALVSYHFSGVAESGLYLGESYNGQASFDDSSLTNSGAETVNLTSLSFSFLSNMYDLNDGTPPVTANFMDGLFLGISYFAVADTDLMFGLIAAAGTGLSDDLPYFAYDVVDGDSGTGSLAFVNVDEPLSLVLLGIGLAFLRLISTRRQS